MTAPRVGDRRPREGRCERCDRPLTDYEWNASPPIWIAAFDPGSGRCRGDFYCSAPIDWRCRCLQAEAERDAAFRDGARHGLLVGAWTVPECACHESWTSRGRHSSECAAWVRDEIAALASDGGGDGP